MVKTADNVLDNILAKKIDKQEARRSFDKLPEEDKIQILATLRALVGGAMEDKGEPVPVPQEEAAAPVLKSLHELNLTDEHLAFIGEMAEEYGRRVPKSKDNALRHQAYFVDQRKTAGLKKALKSLQFQLTYDRAEGAYVYDVDGNRYIDIAGDNGVNLFGHQPEFMKKALTERMSRGYPLVAYSEDLFEAARLFCELTGHERMVFTQSGTEALMWSVRIARAATGKRYIVICDGSYHGLSDAVLAFKNRKGGSMSAGLGMLQEFADQIIILDYGDMEQLQRIEEQAEEIACVLIEPIQSRFPSRQPGEYLQEVRKITLERNIVLIFDEMITGFRAGVKGAEGYFQVKPDISTYGKVAGGGMPTGIIAGLGKYMNYVDGGIWRFDDDSMPSLRRTMMAGTHTQNSLKVAATLAICQKMQQLCEQGQSCTYHTCTCALGELNRKTEALALEINAYFQEKQVPLTTEYFSSLFRFQVLDDPFGLVRELFFFLLRFNGIETSTSGNCFLTTVHCNEDLQAIAEAVKRSVDTLLEHQFFLEPEPIPVHEDVSQPLPEQAYGAEMSSAIIADKNDDESSPQAERLKQLILADLQGVFGGRN